MWAPRSSPLPAVAGNLKQAVAAHSTASVSSFLFHHGCISKVSSTASYPSLSLSLSTLCVPDDANLGICGTRKTENLLRVARAERRERGRQGLCISATANVEQNETLKESSSETRDVIKNDRQLVKAADWKKAEKALEGGLVHRGRIDACNSGGLLVRFGGLQGFLPFSQINVARLPKDGSKTLADVGKDLIGELISVKIIEVSEEGRRLILSEKQAVLVESIGQIQEGAVFDGKVNSVTDFGAFVDLQFPDGTYPVSGLVHVSELSWDPVRNPRDLLEEGKMVRVKVVQVDLDKMRLALSMKQLQADPLLETLDTLMPVDYQVGLPNSETMDPDAELLWHIPARPRANLCRNAARTWVDNVEVCSVGTDRMYSITGVTLGRQKLEKRVVSQDLELWLSNAPAEDGKFTLLARAGRQVQEVQLNTELDREGIKAAVQRVTGRVP